MTARVAAALCAPLVAALLAGSALAEAPTIYKWIDSNGVAHYTTDKSRIPSEIRTRVERVAPSVAAEPHPEDTMRDAVRVKPRPAVSAPPADPFPDAPSETADTPSEPTPAQPAPVDVAPAEPPDEMPVARVEDIPPPLASDVEPEPEPIDPVSSPPPAPVAPLAPAQSAEIAKIDGQIAKLEDEIAAREEKLAALISSADEQRSTPLVDDPAFREISQRLPKLQAELQTLRERRNEIQPPATP